MPNQTVLALIHAHAGAGALTQAWRLFRDAGLDGEGGDPAVLAARGRLLKEEALGAVGPARAAFWRQAAEAYAAAGARSQNPCHQITAAGFWRLAGDIGAAAELAAQILERLDRQPDAAGSPYHRGAIRAEALLLRGRPSDARAALAEALAAAPRAWEDHAATLRQLQMICEAEAVDTAWLDVLRPPRVVHFAGHVPLSSETSGIERRVRERLSAEGAGFGFGALSAGADLVVAEALVDRGAELHLVLPGAPDVFLEVAAARHGEDWAPRYNALIAAAASVENAGGGRTTPDLLSAQLAAEVAMGRAAMRADSLQTEAVQLLVLDLDERGDTDPGGSAWTRDLWAGSGRRQAIVQAARRGRAPAGLPSARPGERLMAVLAVAVDPADAAVLSEALDATPSAAASWAGGILHLAFDRPAKAAGAALSVRAALGPRARVAGHYGAVSGMALAGGAVIMGEAMDRAAAILAVTPAGVCLLSQAMSAAACAVDAHRRVERSATAVDLAAHTPLYMLCA